jgi:hypothetical protein
LASPRLNPARRCAAGRLSGRKHQPLRRRPPRQLLKYFNENVDGNVLKDVGFNIFFAQTVGVTFQKKC